MSRAITKWRDPLRCYTSYELEDGTVISISDKEMHDGSAAFLVAVLESTRPTVVEEEPPDAAIGGDKE
jgi:hypothetical protein